MKKKAIYKGLEFIKCKVIDLDKTICEFYECSERSKNEDFNEDSMVCEICERLRLVVAIPGIIYYCPKDYIKDVSEEKDNV